MSRAAWIFLFPHLQQAGSNTNRIRTLAVLPLKNHSGDPAQEYVADGMTEEVIGRLAMIRGLRVISRTSVMQFKDTKLLAAQIARTLGVDALVEGSVIREGDKIRVKFKHVGGGLQSLNNEALKGFAIAGDDHKFVWAEARVDGDSVVVSSKNVTKPVAVRYAWSDNPICNLYNKAGFPASPFRTDDWPGVTVARK